MAVDNALRILINDDTQICKDAVKRLMESSSPVLKADEIHIQSVDLTCYDKLFTEVMS